MLLLTYILVAAFFSLEPEVLHSVIDCNPRVIYEAVFAVRQQR